MLQTLNPRMVRLENFVKVMITIITRGYSCMTQLIYAGPPILGRPFQCVIVEEANGLIKDKELSFQSRSSVFVCLSNPLEGYTFVRSSVLFSDNSRMNDEGRTKVENLFSKCRSCQAKLLHQHHDHQTVHKNECNIMPALQSIFRQNEAI